VSKRLSVLISSAFASVAMISYFSFKRNLFFCWNTIQGMSYHCICFYTVAKASEKATDHLLLFALSTESDQAGRLHSTLQSSSIARRKSSRWKEKLSDGSETAFCTLQRFHQRDSLPKEQMYYTPHLTHLVHIAFVVDGKGIWLTLRATSHKTGSQIGSSPSGGQ